MSLILTSPKGEGFQPSPSGTLREISYFEIPPDILENPEKLIEWAEKSLSIQKKRK
jgi:hypothetical protein